VLEVQGVLVEEGVDEVDVLVEETLVVEATVLVVGSGVSSPPSTS